MVHMYCYGRVLKGGGGWILNSWKIGGLVSSGRGYLSGSVRPTKASPTVWPRTICTRADPSPIWQPAKASPTVWPRAMCSRADPSPIWQPAKASPTVWPRTICTRADPSPIW